MAQPDRSPSALITSIHSVPVGSSQQGFTLVSRVLIPGCLYHVEVVVSKGANAWTVRYMLNETGLPGKIASVLDNQGRDWFPLLTSNGWT